MIGPNFGLFLYLKKINPTAKYAWNSSHVWNQQRENMRSNLEKKILFLSLSLCPFHTLLGSRYALCDIKKLYQGEETKNTNMYFYYKEKWWYDGVGPTWWSRGRLDFFNTKIFVIKNWNSFFWQTWRTCLIIYQYMYFRW